MRSQEFEITPDILVLIAEIDEFKGAWPHLSARASTRLTSMRQIATLDSVGALMRLAGHPVSDDVVEAALFGRHARVNQSGSASPYVDCATLLDGVYDGFAHIPLGLSYITRLWFDMRRITSDARGVMVPADRRDDQQGGEMPTDPQKTPPEAGKLLEWCNDVLGARTLHPLVATAIFAHQFAMLRPCHHETGPVLRILTTVLLLRAGYGHIPYVSLDRIVERENRLDGAPDLGQGVRCFLQAVKHHKDQVAAKLNAEAVAYHNSLPQYVVDILEFLARHGRITTHEAAMITGASIPTAKSRLKKLRADGVINAHGKGRGAFYTIG